MILEICTPSMESVQAALAAAADRIELCENLDIGGTTPSAELIAKVISEFGIDTQVLIRPRGGGFVYITDEIKQMLRDIEMAKSLGAKGVVVGALQAESSLDIDALKLMAQAADGIQLSFHKAMDEINAPLTAIEALISLGFDRILTSGGKPTALQGLEELQVWQKRFGDRIEIMPGGSIRPENIQAFKGFGFAAIHSAAILKGQQHSDENTIRALTKSIRD